MQVQKDNQQKQNVVEPQTHVLQADVQVVIPILVVLVVVSARLLQVQGVRLVMGRVGSCYLVIHGNGVPCSPCNGSGSIWNYDSCYGCGGVGSFIVYCSHGYAYSHYYCSHCNNRTSATHYYCSHNTAGVEHE